MPDVRSWFRRVAACLSMRLLSAYRRPRAFLLGLVVIPLLTVLVLTYVVNISAARRQALGHVDVAARLGAEILSETLEETFRSARQLAAPPAFVDDVQRADRDALERRLEDALAFMPRVDAAAVINPQGTIIAAAPKELNWVGRDVSRDEPFVGSKAAGWDLYLTSVYLREGPGVEKVVSVMWPVWSGDTLVGLVQLQHRVEDVKSWLQKIRLDAGGYLYVVDHRQQLVVHPLQLLPGRPKAVGDWPTVSEELGPGGSRFTYRDADGVRWMAGVHPVGSTGWRVVAVQTEQGALRPLYAIFWSLGAVAGVLLLLVVLIVVQWARLHAFSLRLLRQNAKLLKQGQQRRLTDREHP